MGPALLGIAVISVSALLVLSMAHLSLAPRGGSGDGGGGDGNRVRIRLLLQGTLSLADGSHGPQAEFFAMEQTLEQKVDRGQQSKEEQAKPVQLAAKLTAGADLATFAAPGTHCLITPTHNKVALMFLTHGDLPHSLLWTEWMKQARGLLPRGSLAGERAFCLKQCDKAGNCVQQCSQAAACNPVCVEALQRRMGPNRSPSVLQQQHLFSVYVHARPTLKDYPADTIFAGRLIPDRVMAKWGSHSLAVAAKKLVEAAVLDQSNAWFVLVGDTTVPLYHPAMMWQQLTHESQSRVDACRHKDAYLMRRRYSPDMRSDRFRPDKHWRKSSQWFMLNRGHAELLAHDQEVSSLFGRYCNVGYDQQLKRHRDCISDEHYIPSLLAMYGLDNQTTCDMSGGTFASWEEATDTKEGGHPKTYQPGYVTRELIATMRQTVLRPPEAGELSSGADSGVCSGWAAATQAAREGFVDAGRMTQKRCPNTLGSPEYLQEDSFAGVALDPHCNLLARKFSQPAARWVHRLYRSCSAGLGVLPCSPHTTDADNHWWA